jgi:NADPH2:quinone reductase
MRAAYYTKDATAAAILHVGTIEEIEPGADEVQVEIYYSAINPGELTKGVLQPGTPMPYPFVIPHSDGAGVIKKVGTNVAESWIGKKVLCFGAQSNRAYGTAAEYCSLPVSQVIEITDETPIMQAAQMGIPAITGYMAVHKLNDLKGKTVLVQGGAGAVGQCGIQFAKRAGAVVIATVTNADDISKARDAGAMDVFVLTDQTASEIKTKYPEGVHHIVEVAFAENLQMNLELLNNNGSIASYATRLATPELPFWELVFNNISLYFLGSDDFSNQDKRKSLQEAVKALNDGWPGLEIAKVFKLEDIAEAHEFVAKRKSSKRVLLSLKE